jgi:hypothetical protein
VVVHAIVAFADHVQSLIRIGLRALITGLRFQPPGAGRIRHGATNSLYNGRGVQPEAASTAGDLLKFVRALQGHRLLRAGLVDTLLGGTPETSPASPGSTIAAPAASRPAPPSP